MQCTAALLAALGAANGTKGDHTDFSSYYECQTSKKGTPLSVARPIWMKVVESEQRIAWLTKMVRNEICVRDLEAFAKVEHEKLRSEKLKVREDERQIILGLMKLKLKDEVKHLRNLKDEKEKMRSRMRNLIGKNRGFTNIVKNLKRETDKRKRELKRKYKNKIEHLIKVRQHQLEEKMIKEVPEEIKQYLECCIFKREEFERLKPVTDTDVSIGDIELSEEEKSVLVLNPKFAAMRKICLEATEREIEIGNTKIRYEVRQREIQRRQEEIEFESSEGNKRKIERKSYEECVVEDAKDRQIFDPLTNTLNLAKKRVTDLKENSRIILPKAVDEKLENEMGIIRETILGETKKHIREIENKIRGEMRKIKKEPDKEKIEKNQEWQNLNKKEKEGLRKLRKRIKNGELVAIKTDKSGKLMVMSKDEYLKVGTGGLEGDRRISGDEAKKIENMINNHSRFWIKMTNLGENNGHYGRMIESKLINSEAMAPRYYMFKDHKEKGGWRPVVSGCVSNTLGLSNMLSEIVESLCVSVENPYEVSPRMICCQE